MTTTRWTLCICAALLLVGGLAPVATAANSPVEELTKLLPDDLLFFMGTSGGEALKGDFDKSIMGRIWNDPSTQTFCQSIKTELMNKVQQENGEDVPKVIALALEYANLVLDRPVAFGIAQVPAEKGPPGCLFLIVNAGDRKSDLAAAVTKLEAMMGMDKVGDVEVGSLKMRGPKDNKDVPLYWGWVGNYLVVAGNDAQGVVLKYVSKPRAAVAEYLKKVPSNGDAMTLYYDYARLFGMIDAIAAKEAGEKEAGLVKAIVSELGFANVGALTLRVGFSGPDLVSDTFFQVPEPRTGILAAFKPIDTSVFRMVDAQAVGASASNCDLAGIYDTAMKAIRTVSPDDAYPEIQKGLAQLESEVQISLRDGLLKSLAGPVIFYELPAGKMTEAPMGGIVMVLKLTDGQLFEKNMTALGAFASAKAKGMLQVGSETDEAGRTIHIWSSPMLAIAQVMPAWSVADGHAVIGSNTALCKMGIKQIVSKGEGTKSLLDTDGYKKVAAKLPKNLTGVAYVDSQVQFNQMMMQLQQLWPVAVMAATQAGFKLPVMLPSLGQIAQDMQPACEYSYLGSDGFYSHYRGSGVEVSLRGAAGAAVGAGIAMPALARTRKQARRVASMANLKQVALALHMYADDHDGKFPDELEQAKAYYGSPSILESPRKPKGFGGPSYIYVPGHTANATAPGDSVVVYENPAFCDDTITVAFRDGHVEAMKPGAFRQKLEATYQRLGREMPEIKFKD